MLRELGENEFAEATRFIERETGIRLPQTNYRAVSDFLARRLSALGLDIGPYLGRLRSDREEYAGFLKEVTINETYFFREQKHFAALSERVFPALFAAGIKAPRFWSASCSSGEEALSIAALASGIWPDFEVFASDINPDSLRQFQAAEYGSNSFRQDGRNFHPLLERNGERNGATFKPSAGLMKRMRVFSWNLLSDPLEAAPDHVHAVFLRNTMIYFAMETRPLLLSRLVSRLEPGGYLFLSSTEMPLISHPDLKLEEADGTYFFMKKTPKDRESGVTVSREILSEAVAILRTGGLSTGVVASGAAESGARVGLASSGVRRPRVTPAALIDCANQKIHNRLFRREDDANYDAALVVLDVVYRINAGESTEAASALERLEQMMEENEILLFLEGYLAASTGEKERALRCFDGVLEHNPSFWPARYQSGMIWKGGEFARAKRAFTMTEKQIERYIADGSYEYEFLLEGFNARYFLELCRKWLAKL